MNKFTEKLIEKIKNLEEEDGLLALRDCSICGCSIGWRHNRGHIFFDSNCGCSSYWNEPEYVEPDSLDFYTDQEGFRKEFDLDEPAPTEQE